MRPSTLRSTPFAASTCIAALTLPCLALPVLADAADGDEGDIPAIIVIARTPLGKGTVPPAAPVITADADAIRRSQALDLTDFLNQRLAGISINETQGNPFQPDVNFRGFTASPLLGTPQGLSVWLDGVRLNQPFGDVVSWDLIPQRALRQVTLLPGSAPLFGQNSLGGALVLTGKDGRSDPGTELALDGGSFGRLSGSLDHGGSAGALDWFLTGTLARDDGWRDDSPSDLRQAYGRLGWTGDASRLHLTLSQASTDLTGNGLQEQRFLERDRSSVYTKPDKTSNRATLANLSGDHELAGGATLSGNIFYRHLHSWTFNGDLNEDSLDQSVYQPGAAERAALAAAGYSGFPTSGANAANTPFPSWRCIAQALLKDEPAEKCNGLLTRTDLVQEDHGGTLQASIPGHLAGLRHEATIGAAYTGNHSHFRQSAQLGYLNPDRSITPVPAYGDGVNGGDVDGEPYDTRVDLKGRAKVWSLFAADNLDLTDALHLSLSARYDHMRVHNRDQINEDGEDSLSGDHRFSRLNPGAGLTWDAAPTLTLWAGYNEGSRAPSAIELGCANPDNPCKLPNAMAGDPPLKQVVARTAELGVRGGGTGAFTWSAGLFRTDLDDDILFVASSQTGYGYFRNVDGTRRQGAQLDATARLGGITLDLDYTFTQATFRSAETLGGEANSSNDADAPGLEGMIEVKKGDRLPLIPRHVLKVRAEASPLDGLSLGAELRAVGSSPARGNENGEHQPDGRYYLGKGTAPGYALVALTARYDLTPSLQLSGRIDNLFDRDYVTAAQLGATGFDANGNFIARPFAAVSGEYPLTHATFYAPGAPRTVRVGVRYRFG